MINLDNLPAGAIDPKKVIPPAVKEERILLLSKVHLLARGLFTFLHQEIDRFLNCFRVKQNKYQVFPIPVRYVNPYLATTKFESTVAQEVHFPIINERDLEKGIEVAESELPASEVPHEVVDQPIPTLIPLELESANNRAEQQLALPDLEAGIPEIERPKASFLPTFIGRGYASHIISSCFSPHIAPLGLAKPNMIDIGMRVMGVGTALLMTNSSVAKIPFLIETAVKLGISTETALAATTLILPYVSLLPTVAVEGMSAYMPASVRESAFNQALSAPLIQRSQQIIERIESVQTQMELALKKLMLTNKDIQGLARIGSQIGAVGVFLCKSGLQNPALTVMGIAPFMKHLGVLSQHYHISNAKNFVSQESALEAIPFQAAMALSMVILDVFAFPRSVSNLASTIVLSPMVSDTIISHSFYQQKVIKPLKELMHSPSPKLDAMVKSSESTIKVSLAVFSRMGMIELLRLTLSLEGATIASALNTPINIASVTGALAGTTVGYLTQSSFYAAASFEIVKDTLENPAVQAQASSWWSGCKKAAKKAAEVAYKSFLIMEEFSDIIAGYEHDESAASI